MHTFFQRKFQRKLIHLTEVAFTFAYGEYCIYSSKTERLFMCRNYCNDCFALMEHKVSQMAAEPFSLWQQVQIEAEKSLAFLSEVPGNTTHYMVTQLQVANDGITALIWYDTALRCSSWSKKSWYAFTNQTLISHAAVCICLI